MKASNKIPVRGVKVLLILSLLLFAALCTSVTAMASPKIGEVEYQGKGRVSVEFTSAVKYSNVHVTVKDSNGKEYKTKIKSRGKEVLVFVVKEFRKDRSYSFSISGIKKANEKQFGSVEGTFRIPKQIHGISIHEIELHDGRTRAEFEFLEKVEWKNPKVSIKAGGKEYVKTIQELEDNEIEVLVKKLKKGQSYTYKITGIRKKGNKKYVALSGSFTA